MEKNEDYVTVGDIQVCPDVSQHHIVWKLLEPQKSDMTLTEAGQIIPEQSTAAIVVHHPEAEYFVL